MPNCTKLFLTTYVQDVYLTQEEDFCGESTEHRKQQALARKTTAVYVVGGH
jgi:hypothetical protein